MLDRFLSQFQTEWTPFGFKHHPMQSQRLRILTWMVDFLVTLHEQERNPLTGTRSDRSAVPRWLKEVSVEQRFTYIYRRQG